MIVLHENGTGHFFDVCTDGAAVMIGCMSGLTVRIEEVAPECEATHCVIQGKC